MKKAAKKTEETRPATELKCLPAADLVQLNQCFSDAQLAAERFEHSATQATLLQTVAELGRVRAELQALQAQETNRTRHLERTNDKKAAEARLQDLTSSIRRTHNLTEKHGIDPISGEILAPRN